MKPYVIGLDLGTGSAKALAMTTDGKVIGTAQASYPTQQPQPGFQEQNPALVEEAFFTCIAEITRARKHPPEAIALSSAMHSLIPLDASGEPLAPAMIWADNRSAQIARELHQSPLARTLYEETGTPIHPMSPLCKLLWLRKEQPALFGRSAKFVSIKEYIWQRLFGEFEVDYSIASATGLLDITRRTWSTEALAIADVRPEQLSTTASPAHTRRCQTSDLHKRLGIDADTPFLIGASDGCFAALGSFINEPGTVSLTIGTSGAVRVMRDSPVHNFNAMIFNYLLDESTYVCGGPTNNGGVALKWYAANMRGIKLQHIDEFQTLLRELNESPPGARGLTFLPYVLGERAPVWNSEASGAFFGLRTHHRAADLTRAVVEGISSALYDIADHMMEAGLDVRKINVSGGFIHSPDWMQLLADLFGKQVALITAADASAYGAGMLALKTTGAISGYGDLAPEPLRTFSPDGTHMSAYRELFLRYRKLYESTRHMMA